MRPGAAGLVGRRPPFYLRHTGSFGFEFAQVAVSLAIACPDAKTIRLVMDNLNIPRRSALAQVFGPGCSKLLAKRS